MSVSTKEFKEQLRKNREFCFCGERLKVGWDGVKYCPKCKLRHGEVIGWVTYKNGCTEVVRA